MSNKVIILITITARETHAAASVKCVLVLHNAIPSLLICYFCFSLCQTNWLDPSEEIHTSVLWQKSKNKQANKYILKKEEIFVYITNHYNPTVIQEHHINEHLLLKKTKIKKWLQKVIILVMRCFHPWVVNIEGHGLDEKDQPTMTFRLTNATHTHTHKHTLINARVCAWKKQRD